MRPSSRFTIGYVVLAAVDSWLAGSSRPATHRARRVTKPLLMPTLAASLVTDERARRSPLRSTTLVAQAFGWGGDVSLLGAGRRAFALGAASFGAGHVSYLSGLVRQGGGPATGARAAAAAFVVGGPAMALGAGREHPALGAEVLAYTGVLSAVLGAATALGPSVSPAAKRLTVAGAASFVLSDSILGARLFLWPGSPDRLESVVMATYTTAQLLLSRGAARA